MRAWTLVVHPEPRTLPSCVHGRIPSGPELEQHRGRRSPLVMAEAVCHCPKGADGGHLQKDPWMWRPPPAPAAPSLHLPPRPVWAFLSGLLSSGSHESLLPLSDFRVSWNHHSRQEAVPRIPFAEEFCRAHTVFFKTENWYRETLHEMLCRGHRCMPSPELRTVGTAGRGWKLRETWRARVRAGR